MEPALKAKADAQQREYTLRITTFEKERDDQTRQLQALQEAIDRLRAELASLISKNTTLVESFIANERAKIDAYKIEEMRKIKENYERESGRITTTHNEKCYRIRQARDKLEIDKSKFEEEYNRQVTVIHEKCDSQKNQLNSEYSTWEHSIHIQIQNYTEKTDEEIARLKAAFLARQQ